MTFTLMRGDKAMNYVRLLQAFCSMLNAKGRKKISQSKKHEIVFVKTENDTD